MDKPYHNIIRKNENKDRLTGVHMMKTKEYYTDKLKIVQKKYNQNILLRQRPPGISKINVSDANIIFSIQGRVRMYIAILYS